MCPQFLLLHLHVLLAALEHDVGRLVRVCLQPLVLEHEGQLRHVDLGLPDPVAGLPNVILVGRILDPDAPVV